MTGEREPVRLCATSNIDVDAGGLVMVDGIQTEVLLIGQTDASENGIRTASEGQWYRAADARTARTMQKGTTVTVQEGSANVGKIFKFNTLDPVIGDDSLTFVDVTPQLLDADLTAIAALTTQPYGRSLLTLAAAEDLRNRIDSASYVPTRIALKALDTTKDATAVLTESGREGIFVWTTGNFAARITADTAEGLYVKADAIASSAGAWVRSFSGPRNARWFGIVGDGTTDDTAALAAAFTNAGSGVSVLIPSGYNVVVDSTLTVPAGCMLTGEKPCTGGNGMAAALPTMTKVYVNSAGTLSIGDGCSVRNLAICRRGLTFNITSAQVASDFLGIGVTIRNASCNIVLQDLVVLGFDTGIASIAGATNVSRVHMQRIHGDNINGISLTNSFDVTYIREVHFWPYVTAASTPEAGNVHLVRSGAGILSTGVHDWTRVESCFNFGYFRGFEINNAGSAILSNCGADHVAASSDGSIGFLIEGTSNNIKVISCQTAAKQFGFYSAISSVTGSPTFFIGCNTWEFYTYGFVVNLGDAVISDCMTRRTAALAGSGGIRVSNAANVVDIENCRLYGADYSIDQVANAIVRHRGCVFSPVTGIINNPYFATTIASAATITLNGSDKVFKVSGTTDISAVSPVAAYAGKEVSLIFTGALNLISGGNLSIAGKFPVSANDQVTLFSDGTNWFLKRARLDKQIATVVTTAVALSNSSTSPQNVFASANDALTLKANTSYRFRGRYKFNTGATSHTTLHNFGGTAGIASISYDVSSISAAAGALATPQQRRMEVATQGTITAASTAVTTDVSVEGILRTSTAGTLIPQIAFNAGPTGICETAINSFFEIEEFGADTVAAVGDWA
ncbi:hypothetical protein [Mesorhizobium sp. LjNodule214]|uniref:hypothetical protein n=1 Tax=Mesorhizobium sp. LjNodule214 TaxID=3342252 RepID=UPI003ECF6C2B